MIDIPGIYVGRFKTNPNQSTMLMKNGDTPTYTDDNWANVESTGTIWRYSSEAGEWIDTGLEEILVEEVSGTKEIVAEGTVPWKLQGLKVYGKSTQDGTPSPEHPVPIVSAGDDGNVDVSVAGKNLFDYSRLIKNKAYSITGEELVSAVGYMSTPKISVIPGAPYRVNANTPNAIAAIWVQWDKEGNPLSRKSSVASNYAENLLPKTAYLAITFYSNVEPQWLEKAIISYGLDEIVYEPYKGLQFLTLSTPNGLPGIPVDSGGNFTDADGQQWVCDEVDFARGVYVQRIQKIASYTDEDIDGPYMSTTGGLTSGAMVVYALADPLETPLSAEELDAYSSLMSYDGSTVISTDEDVSGISAKVVTDVVSKNAWFDPYAELALYYKALAGFESLDNLPMPHSRESSLVRKLLDSSYELGFGVNELSSRNERYLWDLINGTSTMLTNVPKSDTEKFLHVMIGGTVEEYPVVDTELDYWMDKCVDYMSSNGNIGG